MGELTLVAGAAARDAPGNDLAALADEVLQATDVLVVDEVHPLNAELADFAPAEPAALDRLLRGRDSRILLKRHVVVGTAAAGLVGKRRGCRRHRGSRRALRPTHELHALGHDLGHGPLLAVFAFPVARL